MSNLHVFIAHNLGGEDYIIAADETDARTILADITGEACDDYDFEQWPDDDVFTLTEIDAPGHPQASLLPAEWARIYGRRYMGGTA